LTIDQLQQVAHALAFSQRIDINPTVEIFVD
jgi:hypothetical protein